VEAVTNAAMTNPLQSVAADLGSIPCRPVTAQDRAKVRLLVAANAGDKTDLAQLLDMLGLGRTGVANV
jgi:hypothetical protein